MSHFQEPKHSQPTHLPLEFPKRIVLENGVILFLLDEVKDDSVKLDIEWSAGSKYQSKPLVANFTNKLLMSGDPIMSGSEIAEKIDFHGGYFQNEMDRDHAGITLFGLNDKIGDIFGIFSNAFMNCTFPLDEFEKERSVSFSKFQIDSKKVKNQCTREFTKSIFGEQSDYGKVAVAADFKTIEQLDVLNFYKEFYLNGKPTIFIVGRVDDAFINQLRDWSRLMVSEESDFKVKEITQAKGRINVDVPGSVQTAIRIGRLLFDKTHPDYFKFQLLNTILGGFFGSRLMTNIREDKGYTYGIGSTVSVMEDAAYFFIATEAGTDVSELAINEVLFELKRLREVLIPEEELTVVKNYMSGDFLRHADGAIAQMENFKNIHFNQLKETYYTDFIQAVNEATAKELQDLANKYLKEDELLVVTAG